ncbi:unnamed protein product [Musa acuminata subsp. malaccensis]|uniref:(wild Malaysian banana) hypothetical protein n=1 Tax=Musa acuminata subsp. malaccensis TaxID=214687 RepID=A0A804LAU8_MUSAM|nr:unnamed protein product [Musa acuminata subsp. malaccensis]
MPIAHHESTPISSFPLYIPLVAPSEIVDVVGEEVEIYMDEKWKVANKEIRNSCSGGRRVVAAAEEEGGPFLKRSASTREGRRRTTTIKTSRSFSSRCANQVKEQRARLYIMRRCVTMLVCWRDYH